ncbi:unnamed protein product [Closterium sp. NIES-53]
MLVLVVITARKPIYVTEDSQINLKNWVRRSLLRILNTFKDPHLVATHDLLLRLARLSLTLHSPTFKDPHLVAPDDLLLCLARLALTCTAMPTASRPTMAQAVGQLQAMEQEVAGREVDRAAVRIDREIEGAAGAADFDAELARAMHVGGGGGGGGTGTSSL